MAGPNLQISGVVKESLLTAASPPLTARLVARETLMQALTSPRLQISGMVRETLMAYPPSSLRQLFLDCGPI